MQHARTPTCEHMLPSCHSLSLSTVTLITHTRHTSPHSKLETCLHSLVCCSHVPPHSVADRCRQTIAASRQGNAKQTTTRGSCSSCFYFAHTMPPALPGSSFLEGVTLACPRPSLLSIELVVLLESLGLCGMRCSVGVQSVEARLVMESRRRIITSRFVGVWGGSLRFARQGCANVG